MMSCLQYLDEVFQSVKHLVLHVCTCTSQTVGLASLRMPSTMPTQLPAATDTFMPVATDLHAPCVVDFVCVRVDCL